jgi:methylmalonyl-CoA mutase N-terminal domain/subunit
MTEETKKIVLESGIEVKPVYGPQDVATGSAEEKIGSPGEYPFTRGIHSLMYRKRPFTMRQYSGFASAAETNERFKFLIDQGQTGLNVAFDLPTQMGLDSDDERSFGEVGRVGMAVDSIADMEIAFDGIPLDKITVSLTINAVAIVLMGMYFAMAEKRDCDLKSLRGTAQNDILKEFVGRGSWIFPVEPSIRLIGDTIEFCSRQVPKYSPVSVCGYHIRESGADPVQEMAYAFGIARAYADEALRRGLDIDEFAGRLSFNFDIFGNLFEQVAKFRAGRRYWARIIRDEYHAKDPRSMWLRMIAGGGGGGLTIEQPENNIVRGAYYALISALSGTQTMALCSYDEAYTIPSEKAALISLRTMQLLIEEMGLADTVDPLGGSYYVEALTDEMEKRIEECLKDVIDQGGMVKLVADGTIQRQVARQAYQTEKKIQVGEIHKVGVNCYRVEEEERTVELHPYDENATIKQQERVRKIRTERSQSEIERCLAEVRQAAENGENLMPPIIDAVKAYATLGEITTVMKEVFGEFKEPVGF